LKPIYIKVEAKYCNCSHEKEEFEKVNAKLCQVFKVDFISGQVKDN